MIVWSARKRKAVSGLAAVLFIVLIGALGYLYVLNYKSEVATAPTPNKTITAQTVSVPAVTKVKDLDAALQTLDAASIDSLSDADLNALQAQVNSF